MTAKKTRRVRSEECGRCEKAESTTPSAMTELTSSIDGRETVDVVTLSVSVFNTTIQSVTSHGYHNSVTQGMHILVAA